MVYKYDKYGNELTLTEWCALMEDSEYRRIALTKLANGIRISTIWMGLDHRFGGDGPPVIFETMVFDDSDASNRGRDLGMWRYCTELDAQQGHIHVVDKWMTKAIGPKKVLSFSYAPGVNSSGNGDGHPFARFDFRDLWPNRGSSKGMPP